MTSPSVVCRRHIWISSRRRCYPLVNSDPRTLHMRLSKARQAWMSVWISRGPEVRARDLSKHRPAGRSSRDGRTSARSCDTRRPTRKEGQGRVRGNDADVAFLALSRVLVPSAEHKSAESQTVQDCKKCPKYSPHPHIHAGIRVIRPNTITTNANHTKGLSWASA